jgi:hypothetical protein
MSGIGLLDGAHVVDVVSGQPFDELVLRAVFGQVGTPAAQYGVGYRCLEPVVPVPASLLRSIEEGGHHVATVAYEEDELALGERFQDQGRAHGPVGLLDNEVMPRRDVRELGLTHVEKQPPHRPDPNVSVGLTEEELFAVYVSPMRQVIARVQEDAEERFFPEGMSSRCSQDLTQPRAASPGGAEYPDHVLRIDAAREHGLPVGSKG